MGYYKNLRVGDVRYKGVKKLGPVVEIKRNPDAFDPCKECALAVWVDTGGDYCQLDYYGKICPGPAPDGFQWRLCLVAKEDA